MMECGHPFGYVDFQLTMGTILEWPIVGYTRRRRGEICPSYSNSNTIIDEAGITCLGVHMHNGRGGQARCFFNCNLSPLTTIFHAQSNKSHPLGILIGAHYLG